MASTLRQQRLRKAAEEDPAAQNLDTRPGAASLIHVTPETIAPTPLNTRDNFGTDDELAELGESMRARQLQAVVVVAQADYLRVFPEHSDDARIRRADYVLVSGERRWRAARQAELPLIDATVRPQLADSRADFLDALFAENFYRQNLDPIEEARAVEAMVAECGTAAAAAVKFRRHETWVSQRRALLRLSPDLQGLVRSGELPVRIARSIARLPEAEQEAGWLEALEAEETQHAGKTADKQRAGGDRGEAEAAGSPEPGGAGTDGDSADPEPGAGSKRKRTRDSDPGDDGAAADIVPWHSPSGLARIIQARLAPEAVAELVEILTAT